MTRIEFAIDKDALAKDLELSPERAHAVALEETYFIMPVRFCIGDVDLFMSPSSAEPWIPLPVLGFANRLLEGLQKVQPKTNTSIYLAGGGSLQVALLAEGEVVIECSLTSKTGSDGLGKVMDAARMFSDEVQRLLLSRAPLLRFHPSWVAWFPNSDRPF